MLDHIIIKVADFEPMAAYYTRVLGAIGYVKGIECPGGLQLIDNESGDNVWIQPLPQGAEPAPLHIAWRVKTPQDVQRFYDAALDGGTDNGAPGPRDYHPGYYACFVHDPEGNNIEAILHDYQA